MEYPRCPQCDCADSTHDNGTEMEKSYEDNCCEILYKFKCSNCSYEWEVTYVYPRGRG